MPTVIDSLVVELGLDPKKFNQGQKDALAAFKKTHEEASKTGKGIEAAGERGAQFFNKMRNQALGFLSLLVGGVGLKQFVQNVTTSDAAVGRLSRTIQTSSETLSVWRGAAVVTGGTAEGTTASIQGLVNQFQTFAITGQSQVLPYFRALGVQLSDAQGKMRSFDDVMLDLADAFKKMEPARARAFGLSLGLDEGTINLLLRGSDAVRKLLAEQKALAIVTKEQSDNAEGLAKSWHEASQAAEGFGRSLLNNLGPGMKMALETATSWFQAQTKILDRATAMKDAPRRRSSTGAAPPMAETGSLRLKRGATAGGDASLGLMALAQSLQADIPELNQFTALNDRYHALLGAGQHPKGLALDFTLKDAAKSEDVAKKVREQLAALGIDATVIDEYKHPSRNSTGGHIHVGFANAAAAARYQELNAARQAAGGGAPSVSTTNIGTITVNTQATDAAGIARELPDAIRRSNMSSQAQSGPN